MFVIVIGRSAGIKNQTLYCESPLRRHPGIGYTVPLALTRYTFEALLFIVSAVVVTCRLMLEKPPLVKL
jgi:hypothetical protein